MSGMQRIAGFLLLVFVLGAGNVAAQTVKLAPVDEAAGDATWTRFRARLIEALLKRDEKFMLGILDRNVRNISGPDGVAEFRKLWEMHSADSPLWSELPKVLFLGSSFVKQDRKDKASEVCAPYVYFKWPADAPDAANAAVITREALLKAGPAASTATLQTLSYDLLHVANWEVADDNKDSKQIWVAVRGKTGTGYLPQEQVRSPLEYRACFVKRDGNWRMCGLEVGE
jgi:hypothetical protein